MTIYIQAALLDPEIKKVLETLKTDMLTNSVNATAVQADLDATEATIITDLGRLRTAVIAALTAIDAANTKINTLATKLNADAGVTDTNYATNFVTTNVVDSSPAAISTT